MTAGHPKVHQPALAELCRDELLTREELRNARAMLTQNKTLEFTPVKGSNLYSSGIGSQATSTVWVRDNVFAAWSLYTTNQDGMGTMKAVAIINDLASFFLKHAASFDDIIGDEKDAANSMARPHVRFNGSTFEMMQEHWNHKQNDAIGYFIWLRCRLCVDGPMRMTGDHLRLLGLMLEYLVKIEYWHDEDSGHWEELPKVSASSIGAVVAGAKEFKKLLDKYQGMIVPCSDGILDLIEANGLAALKELLPHECSQPGKERDHDAALLFLIYPLKIVDLDMARTILKHVEEQLLGKVGMRRWNGDSFWCKDFKTLFSIEGKYTKVTYSDQDIQLRHQFVQPGEEAQWCLFDPVLSTIYGELFKEYRSNDDLKKQQYHFCRSLGHVTGPECPQGEWHFPECYVLSENAWVPNDTCGSLWVKANVNVAFKYMDDSVALSSDDLKAEFKRFDIHGAGGINLDDMVMVLSKLNENVPADDLVAMLKSFAPNGKIDFDALVDGLFVGNQATPEA